MNFDQRIQVCYALATDGESRYVDLTAISALAVRRIHPHAEIAILTDEQSLPIITSLLEAHGLAGNVRSIGTYAGSTGARSRFVKTQVRQFINGDFVYLDADAIPIDGFDAIFRESGPVCAAIDRSPAAPAGSGFPSFAVAAFDRLGWSHPARFYVNCGVVFWKDSETTRRLGQMWHKNWQSFYHESNDYADQQAFNYTLNDLGINPTILNDKYNARVGLSPAFALGAAIYHFYASDYGIPGCAAVDRLLSKFREGAELNVSVIQAALAGSQDHTPECGT